MSRGWTPVTPAQRCTPLLGPGGGDYLSELWKSSSTGAYLSQENRVPVEDTRWLQGQSALSGRV
jgi:hypothetical protein